MVADEVADDDEETEHVVRSAHHLQGHGVVVRRHVGDFRHVAAAHRPTLSQTGVHNTALHHKARSCFSYGRTPTEMSLTELTKHNHARTRVRVWKPTPLRYTHTCIHMEI